MQSRRPTHPYGFRPKRGQHDALDALVVGITSKKVNYILDADIQGFFDAVSQTRLVRFLEHRIADPRIIHLIQKWLKAGILEDGVVTVSDTGTGHGSVISCVVHNTGHCGHRMCEVKTSLAYAPDR